MVEQVLLEIRSVDFGTGEPKARYQLRGRCSCRSWFARRTVPVAARRLRIECPFCGDAATALLHGAHVEHAPLAPRSESYAMQETRCIHPECGAPFEFKHSADDGLRLHAVCLQCGSVKAMRRRERN